MRASAAAIAGKVGRDGFALVAGLLDQAAVASMVQAIDGADRQGAVRSRSGSTCAIRNLLRVVPQVGAAAGDG